MTSTFETSDQPETVDPPPVRPASRAEESQRHEHFVEGVRTLRVGGASVRLEERLLMVLGGILAPLGVVVVLLGWWGASRTPYVFEQVPYLVSGGLLGLALVFLGAFLYFAHWMTQLVKESRAQSAATLVALERLHDALDRRDATAPAVRSQPATNGRHAGVDVLVATSKGTMAHRADCAVVAGKSGLRRVEASEGLAPCKLCEPYPSLTST